MTTYKQITRLDWSDVQGLCIERGWYTLGSNARYNELQHLVWTLAEMDADGIEWTRCLQEIAEDIKDNSDTEYEVADIMTALNLKCRRWFEEA